VRLNPVTGTAPYTVNYRVQSISDSTGDTLSCQFDAKDGLGPRLFTLRPPYANVTFSATYTQEIELAYSVVWCWDGRGGFKTDREPIVVNLPAGNAEPQASLSASATTGSAPLAVQFAVQASDPNGDLLHCTLGYGFEQGETKFDVRPGDPARTFDHVYTKRDAYQARVECRDNRGGSADAPQWIDVDPYDRPDNYPPLVRLRPSKTAGDAKLGVSFFVSGVDPEGDDVTCDLDFGDGLPPRTLVLEAPAYSDETAPHTYYTAARDPYVAELVCRDGADGVATKSTAILVNRPAGAAVPAITTFAAAPAEGSAPLAVTFTLAADDPDSISLNCTLDYGDGEHFGLYTLDPFHVTRTHVYATGTYTARLYCCDDVPGGQTCGPANLGVASASTSVVSGTPGVEPRCGDGRVDAGEQCDDGNVTSGDGCASDCTAEYCGDGTVQPGAGELCDDGNATGGDGCTPDCRTEYCGDGTLQPGLGEECDDGNLVSGDGCDATCRIELPPHIVGQPTDVTVVAGGDAGFHVMAEGARPLSYRWQRWNGSSWAEIAGATEPNLTLPRVSLGDDGAQVRCEVSNSLSGVDSDAATLHVTEVASRVTDGLLALYRFDDGTGTTVRDVSGVGVPLDLTIASAGSVRWEPGGGLTLVGPTQIASPGPATKISDSVSANGALTVEAWVDPASLTQNGPARIVTVSADPYARNFTLGQGVAGGSSELYDVRLRTSSTSTNGMPSLSTPAGTLTAALTHVVYTRDPAGATRIYLDGALQAQGRAVGDLSGWDPALRLALGDEFGSDTSRTWLGTYELVAFYDRALEPAEVLENYLAGPVHCGADGALCQDACPADPAKTEPGACGCGVPDLDTDADGVADCSDASPADPTRSGPMVFDRVSAGSDWVTVELPGTYQNPIVIAGLPSIRAGDPGVVQVRNVGATSFEIRFGEWMYLDGVHTPERIPYIVIEAGRYAMNDGSTWEAGRFAIAGVRTFTRQGFTAAFPGDATLLLTTQTTHDPEPAAIRARNVTSDDFEVALFEEESHTDRVHMPETVGYLAVHAAGEGGLVYAAGQFRPYVLRTVMLNSAFRPVGEWLAKIEEDASLDTETNHTLETVFTLAIEGKLYGQIVSFAGRDTCTLRYKLP